MQFVFQLALFLDLNVKTNGEKCASDGGRKEKSISLH